MKTRTTILRRTYPKTAAGHFRTACATRLLPLLLFTLPAVGQAEDYTYTTNNGTLTITGYTGPGGAVIIPDTLNGLPVTSIGDGAFVHSTILTSVTIPNNVTNIGGFAFWLCSSLNNVTLGHGVSSIGERAFNACPRLAAITVDVHNYAYSSVAGVLFNKKQNTLFQYPGGKSGGYSVPNGVTSIETYAFAGCPLTSIALPDGVTSIGTYAFAYCGSLTNITLGKSITNIGVRTFDSCTRLASVTIPDSVTSIRPLAFADCASLTNVHLGKSVTPIGSDEFRGCVNLNAITVDALNPAYSSVGGVLLDKNQTTLVKCPQGKTSVTIPDSVTSIGSIAFYSCVRLTNVHLGKSVPPIGFYELKDCDSLEAITVDAVNPAYSSVAGVLFDKNQTTLIKCPRRKTGGYKLPDSVTSIGSFAFAGCAFLTSVTIPSSVASIGESAFSGCNSLTGYFFEGNAPSLGGYLPSYESTVSTVYHLPGTTGWGLTFGGLPTSLWSQQLPYFYTVDKGEVTINKYTGSDSQLTIPSLIDGLPVARIGTNAFERSSLINVTLPNSVTTIGNEAFIFCFGLTNITIGNGVTSIGDYAFYYCPSLSRVTLGSSVTSIGGVCTHILR